MAPLNGMNDTTVDGVEAPQDSATSRTVDGVDLKHNGASDPIFVDTRTGKPVDVSKVSLVLLQLL